MKTFNASDFVMPTGFKTVDENNLIDVLSQSGTAAFRLHEGDIIEITATIFSRQREGSDKRVRTIPYIGCFRNGKACAIPFSAFRDFPVFESAEARANFLSESPVTKALAEATSDLERFNYLKEHPTLKVAKTVAGRARDWNASPVNTPAESVKYTTRQFPVLIEG